MYPPPQGPAGSSPSQSPPQHTPGHWVPPAHPQAPVQPQPPAQPQAPQVQPFAGAQPGVAPHPGYGQPGPLIEPESAPASFPAAAPAPEPSGGGGSPALELFIDKTVDFILIFVGLYAAMAVQDWQDAAKDKQGYISLLRDFKRELDANLEQEASIVKDLGEIEDTTPGKNLGPMQSTFKHFFEELKEDEKILHCMHTEFVAAHGLADAAGHDEPAHEDDAHAEPAEHGDDHGEEEAAPERELSKEECHALYAQFDKAHSKHEESFNFQPAALTPFYRREVWQLYLADGVTTFRNKELAVSIAEVYANAALIEEQIQDIEDTFNDAFMPQVGRTAATDMELAEIVHDEETQHALSAADMTLLLHVDEAIKEEHYAALEVERTLELKVERMKKTVLVMRGEMEDVQKAIDVELGELGADD